MYANVGPQGLLMVRLPALFVPHSASLGPDMAMRVLSAPAPISAPRTSLDECLFFYLLGVGHPCCSIFCQFWLCEEAQCGYLHRHLGCILKIAFLSTTKCRDGLHHKTRLERSGWLLLFSQDPLKVTPLGNQAE